MPAAYDPLRWTRQMIATESSFDVRKIPQIIAERSIVAGEDGKFSTAQRDQIVFGDIKAEKLKRETADRKTAEIKAATAEGSVVMKSDYIAVVEDIGIQFRQLIEGAKYLDADQRAKLLGELQKVKVETR